MKFSIIYDNVQDEDCERKQMWQSSPGPLKAHVGREGWVRVGLGRTLTNKLCFGTPDESSSTLTEHARRIGEVLARTQSPVERVATVESSNTAGRFDALLNEVSELKLLLKEQVTPNLGWMI